MATEEMVHKARCLSVVEVAKLEKDQTLVAAYKQAKFEKEAQKNWDLFYKRNTTKFFKDRHWAKREFHDLLQDSDKVLNKKRIFEVGCGVGNFMFPLLEEDQNLSFYACDFSKRAIEFIKTNPLYDPSRCEAFVFDITKDDLTNSHIPKETVDVATLIFVLSSIHPEKMLQSLVNIKKVLKPSGCLLFRDYGLYDYAMLRFTPGHKLSKNFYVRQDGTRAFYFSLEDITKLTGQAGFTVASLDYIKSETVNRKEGLAVPRIFVQGKFIVSYS